MKAITELQTKIDNLKAGRTLEQLKNADKKAYYKVKSLVAKLSELKAAEKGNYITKEHLVEFKSLIIWLMTKKVNYRGYLNLSQAMKLLLNTVESEKIIYKTKRGIKGIVVNLAIRAALENIEANLREANGLSVLDNNYGNAILEAFEQHKIEVLMNN